MALNPDIFVMIARAQQEQRIVEAARLSLLFEAESARHSSRAERFTRRTRDTR